MKRAPNWTYEEIVVVAALLYRSNWKYLDPKSDEVCYLSRVLNNASIHPLEVRGDKFRNPSGVARKMVNLYACHPEYTGAPSHGGKTDRIVVEELLEDPKSFFKKADEILNSLIG